MTVTSILISWANEFDSIKKNIKSEYISDIDQLRGRRKNSLYEHHNSRAVSSKIHSR